MKFSKISVKYALNNILAHSIVIDGKRLNKGKILNNKDILHLKKNKIEKLTCAILDKNDIQEDTAANQIIKNFKNNKIAVEKAFTGRANILAAKSGLLVIDEEKINKFNKISTDITIATLRNYVKVEKGEMIATIKIISFSVPDNKLKRINNLNLQTSLTIFPFQEKKCGLILTQGYQENDKLNSLSEKRIRERLIKNNCKLIISIKCKHDKNEIAKKISLLKEKNFDIIFILGASAIVDERDEIPEAIKFNGGKIIRFGMPVDPGNLLLIAKDKVPIIGLPGCARSPALNGFDWILERLVADIEITSMDISKMGIGGLLKTRKSQKNKNATNITYKICNIILAAGKSKRMNKKNKLLSKIKNSNLISKVVSASTNSNSAETIVVVGHQRELLEDNLKRFNVKLIFNKQYNQGMSSSIKMGISSLPEDCDAVIIMLGDMPDISTKLLNSMIDSFNPELKKYIIVPTYKNKLGNPALISRMFFPDILKLKGDYGAKSIIKQNMNIVSKLPQRTAATLLDIDNHSELKTYLAKHD